MVTFNSVRSYIFRPINYAVLYAGEGRFGTTYWGVLHVHGFKEQTKFESHQDICERLKNEFPSTY